MSRGCCWGGCHEAAIKTHVYTRHGQSTPFWRRDLCASHAWDDAGFAATEIDRCTMVVEAIHAVGSEASLCVEIFCHGLAAAFKEVA